MTEKTSHKYLAATIGPIFATLNLASSPGALWTGSYMFSCITKTICKKLVEKGVPEENIISPYYSKDCDLLNKNDGVGLFHDRIIVRINEENEKISDLFNTVKTEALKEVANNFLINDDYLNDYVRISFFEYEADHAIKGCSKILDSFELATPFVCEDGNKIFAKFVNEGKEKANKQIKDMPILKNVIGDKWQLNKKASDGAISIKTLEDIAAAGFTLPVEMKKHTYYAVVRSDGDRMSHIFMNLSSDEEIREYSRICLEYCSKIAELVKSYGGVTVYSGGDDLLALMPLEKKNSSECECADLFAFIKKANDIMNSSFKGITDRLNIELQKRNGKDAKKIDYPTLSFGVSVIYNKHPLYEAIQDSQDLLFDVAKNERNCTALRVQKHSGQSEGIIIPNSALDKLITLKNNIDEKIKDKEIKDNADRPFLSALYKLTQFESFFDQAKDNATVENLFYNFFDSKDHDNNDFLKEKLPEYFWGICSGSSDYSIRLMDEYLKEYLLDHGYKKEDITEDILKEKYPTVTLCYILRILKLYYEKAGERN